MATRRNPVEPAGQRVDPAVAAAYVSSLAPTPYLAPPTQTPQLAAAPDDNTPIRILFVDTETTGLAGYDRIITVGIVETTGAEVTDNIHLIFDPGRDCHPMARAVHGWDDWTLRHQDQFADHAKALHAKFSRARIVVMHNKAFDLRFLNREFGEVGLPPISAVTHCTMEVARERWPGQSASLDACLARIGRARATRLHGAFEDAVMTMNLYLHLHDIPGSISIVGEAPPTNYRAPPARPEIVPPRPQAASDSDGERESRHLGRIGEEITVEVDVFKADYRGNGKGAKRQCRYVMSAGPDVLVYDGPAVLVGVDGRARFTARVIRHERWGRYDTAQTVVEAPRDIEILMRPKEGRAAWRAAQGAK